MFIRSLFFLITLLMQANIIFAQNTRLNSMGGMKYAIEDTDNSLNPYDFSDNPAWLIRDYEKDQLKFFPLVNNSWGSYKRVYDPQGIHNQGLTITGIKKLWTRETFLGKASYIIERKSDLPKTLKYDTYSGEAFFTTDTVTGNFIYDGPAIGFQYCYEPFNDFLTGVELNYKILNGLKEKYSHASSLYRTLDGKIGLAHQISNYLVLGVQFGIFDSQETIESKSKELTALEIYNYRGENNFTIEQGNTVDQKVRKKGISGELNVFYLPAENLRIGLKVNNHRIGSKILIPKQPLIDFEEGYTDQNIYYLTAAARYHLNNNYIIGSSINYNKAESWSKISSKDLMIWKWNINGYGFGFGISKESEDKKFLLGCEYDYSYRKIDSSKYIDNRYIKLFSDNHTIRAGGEYRIRNNLFLRAGYNYSFYKTDLLYGGRNVIGIILSGGLGFTFSKFSIDLNISYGILRPDTFPDSDRKNFDISSDIIIYN
jgi:opacity protein-like surface antigen